MRGVVVFALIVVCIEVFFAVPALSWQLLRGQDEIPVGVGALAAVAISAAVLLLRRRALELLARATARAVAVPARRWFLVLLLLGIGLRLLWVVALPGRATSDAATYLGLSQKLLAGAPYESAGTRAFWPPGYPLFLLPWLSLPVPDRWAVVLANLTLFAATLAVVTALARRIAGEGAARIAGALVAIWPNFVASSGMASKEAVLVLALPLALWLFSAGGRRPAILAGLALGVAALVQPSTQLFGVVLLLLEIARRATLRDAAVRLALVVAAMAVVILPWSIRNYRVFGERVLISTNGGANLYHSNNPLASGHYEKYAERSLEGFDELTRSRIGYQWAKEWITSHPGDFMRLCVRKHVLFLGDDAVGVYDTVRKGLDRGGGLYVILKALANGAWLALWAVMFAALLAQPMRSFAAPASVALAFGFLYFYAIHSIFESAGKYHVPALGLVHTLAAVLVANARAPGDRA